MADEYPGKKLQEFLCCEFLYFLVSFVVNLPIVYSILFISAGPKAYCLRMQNEQGEDEFEWRMKGLPLSHDNRKQLTFARYKEMIESYGNPDEATTTETFTLKNNFRIDKRGTIDTVVMEKRIRPIINKGVVLNTHKIVPFGWSSEDWCKANNPNHCSCKDF